jgi:ABC-type anion transport system duplicated permease subunit
MEHDSGFYHSLVTIPAQLQEAAVYHMNRWQRFTRVDSRLPRSASCEIP